MELNINSIRTPRREKGSNSIASQAGPGKRPAAGLWLGMLMLTLLAVPASAFDAERAMADIRTQCDFGARVPGSPAHIQCRDWMETQMRQLGMTVRREEFKTKLPLTGANVTAWNVWGHAGDAPASPTLIISAHWDSRPWADARWKFNRDPVMGANDAASGVAVALEIYRQLKDTQWGPHLALAFWDAEDSGIQSDQLSWCKGSAYAAENPPDWIDQLALGINLDMVAGKDMLLYPERYSQQAAPEAVRRIWEIGVAIAPDRFSTEQTHRIIDDHWSWIRIRKAPFIDLIGLPYEHWHTEKDIPENCSEEAMQAVGDTLINYIMGGDWAK